MYAETEYDGNAKSANESGEVTREAERLFERIDRIAKAVSVLQAKLSPVARATDEIAARQSDPPRPMLVPLAEKLYHANDRLSDVARAVESLAESVSI